MSVMKCTAAGDAMIFRQLPGHYEGFEALRDFIAQGELRFLNLETTIHNFETYGAALRYGERRAFDWNENERGEDLCSRRETT